MSAIALIPSLLALQLAGQVASEPSAKAPDETAAEVRTAPLPEPAPASASQRWRGSDVELDALASAAESAAKQKSPLTLGRIYRLWNVDKLLERPARVARALDEILAVRGLDPIVDAHARALRAELLRREGKLAEARALVAPLGLVERAMIVGPFENSAGAGHAEAFGPEATLGLDETFEGKAHAVRWRELAGLADTGVFELSALVSPSSEATAYVLVAIRAEKPVTAALRVGASDQLAVFLDGVKLHDVDARRPAALDQEVVPLTLRAGTSLLLVKSSWVSSVGRLMLRLTKPDGSRLGGVTVHGDRATIAKVASERAAAKQPVWSTNGVPAKLKGPKLATVLDGVDGVVAKVKGAALADALSLRADLAAVLSLFDRRKLPTPPERDLEAAIRLDPASPTTRFFYAHRTYDRDPTLAHEQLEAALVSDPGHVPALYRLADMARTSGRMIEANERLDAAIAKDPRFVAAHVARASLRFDTTLDRPLVLLGLRDVAKTLDAGSIHEELARLHRALDDRRSAREAAEKALALDFTDVGARNQLVGLAIDAGDLTRVLALHDQAIALEPWNLGHRLRKARALAAITARRTEAIALLDEAARQFPDFTEIPNQKTELLLFAGDQKAALAELEKSLELDPNQPETRRRRAALSGATQELEDEYGIDAKALAKAPVSDVEESWGAIYLSDRTAIRLYENGQTSRFQQMVIRLRNANLKDALRVQRVPYSPSREVVEILGAERIRPTGETIKATHVGDDGPSGKVGGMYVDRRFKTIVFDDLAAGDLVHIRYRVDSVGSNMFGSFFGDIAGLQAGLPKKDVLYTVITPKTRPLYSAVLRAKPPEVVEDGATTKVTWRYDALEALEMEAFSPPYPDLGKTVSVSTYQSWADLGRWYARLFSEQLELDEAARAAGKKAIAGAKTDAEKIQRLYDYVVKNTRYVGIELGIHGWKPFKASEVHRRRYGDCKDKATLLAALLRDNGIDATITLVRTADRGALPPDHATMWAFNHAITYVPSANLFLDGTAEFSGSNELPYLDQGGIALVVHPDGRTELRTLPESKATDNLNTSEYQATLSRDGSLVLKGVERFHGARASALRQEFEEAETRRSQLEKQLNQVFTGVRIQRLEFSDMTNLEAPVSYEYEAEIARYGAEEAGRYVLPLTLFQHQVASAYASLATRKNDIFVNHPWSTRNVVRYQLPPGTKLESLPEGVELDTPHVSVKQIVRAIPGGFETDDTVTLKSRRVPAADYAAFREACLAVDRALGRKVVLRW
ncbi:DUF3857 domain-containing protein [Myxococcota bacterium]|nr:DUF3857 domain-containing protein [Myxococcota bacterium]